MGFDGGQGDDHTMLEALCIAAMLAGLWSQLVLVTLLRARASASQETAAPISFQEYRRQRDLCSRIIALTVCLPMVCLATAAMTAHWIAMVPGALFGFYLFLGCGYVHRVLDQLPNYGRSDEPALHGLSLALCWPFWAVARPKQDD